MARIGESADLLKCSFCGKSQKQVRKLIAGPGVYICDECIELCNDIVRDEIPAPAPAARAGSSSPDIPVARTVPPAARRVRRLNTTVVMSIPPATAPCSTGRTATGARRRDFSAVATDFPVGGGEQRDGLHNG